MGGEGGARGECHDWVLWNESDDSAGELGSGTSSGVSCGRFKAGVEVRTLSEGAVAARLDAKAATLVRLKRICPAPSIEPASSESESFESLRLALSATSGEPWSALSSGDVVLVVSAMFPTWPFEAAGAIGPTECAFGSAGRCTLLGVADGFFVIQMGSRFFGTDRALWGSGAFGLASRSSAIFTSVLTGASASELGPTGFLASSGGIAVRGGVSGSGSSKTDLNLMPNSGFTSSELTSSGIVSCRGVSIVSNNLRDGGLVGVPNRADPSPGLPSGFDSSVSGVALLLDKSTPKSECLRAFGL